MKKVQANLFTKNSIKGLTAAMMCGVLFTACNSGGASNGGSTVATASQATIQAITQETIANTCVGEMKGSTCTTESKTVQAKFDDMWKSIETEITNKKYKISAKEYAQPTVSLIPAWNQLTPTQKATELVKAVGSKETPNLKLILNKATICNGVKDVLNCTTLDNAPEKSVDRIIEKEPNNVERVLDYSRGSIVAAYEDIPTVIQKLTAAATKQGETIIVLKDRFVNPTSLKYRDAQILLQNNSTKIISEILIFGPQMYKDKNNAAHTSYEAARTAEADLDRQKLSVEFYKDEIKRCPTSSNLCPASYVTNLPQYLASAEQYAAELQQQLNKISAEAIIDQNRIFRTDVVGACPTTLKAICQEDVNQIK